MMIPQTADGSRASLEIVRIRVFLGTLFVAWFTTLLFPQDSGAQCFQPRSSGEISLALERLTVLGSVLYVAAHPDDENSALLAYLANEELLRTGYLSLNRGEGGQNLIGPEKGIPLGIIRSAELLAARNVDGAEQIFTSAYDFGYSDSLEETFRNWRKESLLADVVWAIRKFQPDIIVTRFPITGEGRHGQHTASGVLAEEAFEAAADPTRFKEQLEFTAPWQASALLLNNIPRKWDPNFNPEGKIAVDIGGFNRELGKSYGEIAAESRNNHKSQGFGTAADAGPKMEYFTRRFGTELGSSPFDRSRFDLKNVPGTERLQAAIKRAIESFEAKSAPAETVTALLEARTLMKELLKDRWRDIKVAEVDRLLLDISGAKLEALSNSATLVPGEKFSLALRVLQREDTPIKFCEGHTSWSGQRASNNPGVNEWSELTFDTRVPLDTPPSNAYWLARPMKNSAFDIPDRSELGRPFSPPTVSAFFTFCGRDERIVWSCPALERSLSAQDGDRYEQATVVPPVTMSFHRSALFVPRDKQLGFELTLQAAQAGLSGVVTLAPPSGWTIEPRSVEVSLKEKNVPHHILLSITPHASASNGVLRAEFTGADGTRTSWTRHVISYPHIQKHSYLQPAELVVTTAEIRTPELRVGYIMGAGDEVPQSLVSLGYRAVLLDDETLLRGDLSRFDTIVTGVRALNTRRSWTSFFPRLLEFVRMGGTLLVQYSVNDNHNAVPERFAPFPFVLTSERITDETAEVRFLKPVHSLLQEPNRIESADFDGWIQERGLWFAGKLDSHYETILEMNDPGKPSQTGGVIAARYGAGHFIYTGLAFFRQLPAGNAGAYRLFVNLLSYGHSSHEPRKR